ncbi:MAG TPA: ABC transporter ATP-binding protein [Solirubrobacter sp.]|nr:ABC transporter ATP-binding protein [Solirubrobacter sp.]
MRVTPLRIALPKLRRFAPFAAPHLARERPLVAGGLVALFAEVGFRLLEPWPVKVVVDAVVAPGPGVERVLVLCGVAVVVFVALRALMAYLSTVAFALAGNRVLTRVRADVYDHVQRLSLAQHARTTTGDLVTRLTSDVGRLQEVAVTAGLPLVGNVATLVAMTAVMAVLDWRMALVLLAAFPAFALLGRRQVRRIGTVARDQRRREGDLAALAVETLGAMPVVQAYSLEPVLRERFGRSNRKGLRAGVRARRMAAALERATDVLVGLATASVLVVGAHRVLAGALSPGELVVFLTYLKSAFKPLRDVAKYTGRIARAAASAERLVDLLQTRAEIADASWARPAPAFHGDLRFEDVSAAYRPDRPALHGVTLHVRPGHRLAVAGPSGAGKSTLAALLLRLHDPVDGRVLIDGHDLRDLTLESLRAQIAIVLQESVLFAATVRENIAHGRPGAGDAEIEAAARTANAHAFVSALPDGYDTVLGERGATLSGGQRQRIAIARAVLRDAPIVVLDEALEGLDAAAAQAVQVALDRLTAGRTTLVSAHDLDAVAGADAIAWLEHGRLTDFGPPGEVMARRSVARSFDAAAR